MKTILAYILFWIGHAVSITLRCNFLIFLYPLYKHCMLWSATLDINDRIWKEPGGNK
jgi:hypothetical protein